MVGKEAIQLYQETIARYHAEAKEAGNPFPEVLIEEVWQEVVQQLPKRLETAGVYVPKDTGKFTFQTLSMAFEFRNNPTFPMPEMKRVSTEIKKRGIQLGIESSQTLYVGNDMLNDIYPAQQLGLKTAFFAGDQRSLRKRFKGLNRI